MSNSPLPMHMQCMGVSSDAMSHARYHGVPGVTYADRLAAAQVRFQTSQGTKSAAPAASSSNRGSKPASSPGHAAPVAAFRSPSDLHYVPVPADRARQYMSPPARVPDARPGAPGGPDVTTSVSLDHSVLRRPTIGAQLQTMDFVSIADSSTGGAGIPRPYGKFTAARSGDGNAIWERCPPERGSWQAKALPLLGLSAPAVPPPSGSPSSTHPVNGAAGDQMVSEQPAAGPHGGDASSAAAASGEGPAASALQQGQQMEGAHGSAAPSTSRSLTLPQGSSPGAIPELSPGTSRSLNGQPAGAAAAGGALPSLVPPLTHPAYYRRAQLPRAMQQQDGSFGQPGPDSLVPLPATTSLGWYQLPSATFLTEAPYLPIHIRVDGGHSNEREFLKSGLHSPTKGKGTASSALQPPLVPLTPLSSDRSGVAAAGNMWTAAAPAGGAGAEGSSGPGAGGTSEGSLSGGRTSSGDTRGGSRGLEATRTEGAAAESSPLGQSLYGSSTRETTPQAYEAAGSPPSSPVQGEGEDAAARHHHHHRHEPLIPPTPPSPRHPFASSVHHLSGKNWLASEKRARALIEASIQQGNATGAVPKAAELLGAMLEGKESPAPYSVALTPVQVSGAAPRIRTLPPESTLPRRMVVFGR